MRCKHKWDVSVEDGFPYLKCERCGEVRSVMDVPDDELRRSFGEMAGIMLSMKELGMRVKDVLGEEFGKVN